MNIQKVNKDDKNNMNRQTDIIKYRAECWLFIIKCK